MTDDNPSLLPPLYAGWIGGMLQGPIPPETEATCDDCAMCPKGVDATAVDGRDTYFFSPDMKCCTFLPELHNFLAGRILSDDDPASAKGRATVEKRLQAGIAVSPLGLGRSPVYSQLYDNSVNSFGVAKGFLCPHYLAEGGGRCGIWKNRESVCATYFCKTVRGAVGIAFWKALKQVLSTVEVGLAQWCVLELDMGVETLSRLFAGSAEAGRGRQIDRDALEGVARSETQRALWGKWWGNEREFYLECAHLVREVDWRQITAICGPDLQAFARLAREAYANLLSKDLPARLTTGLFEVVHMGPDVCRVRNSSGILDLSQRLMSVLPYFDGHPTTETLKRIREHTQLRVSRSLLRRLVDFAILVPLKPVQNP